MDPLTLGILASQVVAVLTPFFSKVGEAIATKFGEDAYEESKHLYEVVRDRFIKKDDNGRASKALQNFTGEPELYGEALEKTLLPVLQADPHFADTIQHILQSGPVQRIKVGLNARVENAQLSNELGLGEQIIEGGDGSTFSGISLNIGAKKKPER